jgi:hypothetical protein
VDIYGIMLALRREGQRQGWVKGEGCIRIYQAFKGMVEKKGRVNELRLGLVAAGNKFPLHPFEDAALLFKLWRKGKIR